MRHSLFLCIVLGALPNPAAAQSLLERSPNLAEGWIGTSGKVYFNLLHRFATSAAPERKVTNVPTLTVAAALPGRLLVGFNYATNSQLAPRYPNEWEFFARYALLAEADGAPVDVVAQAAYNLASEGVDGSLAVAGTWGRVRPLVSLRVLADPYEAGRTQLAGGAGLLLALSRHAALGGDLAALFNRTRGERPAWSAGLHVALPYTPHTLSLHASNTNAATLQGASRGELVRWGFEFTVPVTPARWRRAAPAATQRPVQPEQRAATDREQVVTADIRDFKFAPERIEIAAGTVVEWINADQMPHTVTARDGSFDSGIIQAGGRWRMKFDDPGTYEFYCMPHPFMNGVLVVR
jgi:plastocyanin